MIPSADELLSLEVEELAGVLLMYLKSCEATRSGCFQNGLFNPEYLVSSRQTTGHSPGRPEPDYGDKQPQVDRALIEAWAWLENEGFLIRDIVQPASWFWMSRRGQRITSREGFEAYRKASLLPKGQLHPLIAAKVYPAFLRGEYDTAVFQAFREVEVAVRAAGGFPAELVGVDLMAEAFRPVKNSNPPSSSKPPGRITDTVLPVAEQEGMMFVFRGAIQIYKNPQSHRNVPTEAADAAEVIGFASHLLRTVDRLKAESAGSAKP
jgi:uncharacterized protein (TIGR02391 family)